jgi:hypothetical protein
MASNEHLDLNMAFAKNWDRKNPSQFKRACDESKALREDYARQRETRAAFAKGAAPKKETAIAATLFF